MSGTSHFMIFCARSSAIAVLPTHGSQIRTGLFLVLRERIWMALFDSSSLPITGSSLPSSASLVMSLPYLAKASRLISGSCDCTVSHFLSS
jgi:hypothetical protein